jgi:hypothetical protein
MKARDITGGHHHFRINLDQVSDDGHAQGFKCQVDVQGSERIITHTLMDLIFEEPDGPVHEIMVHLLYHILADKDEALKMAPLIKEVMSHLNDETTIKSLN